jgi:hypothetical protein
MVMKGVAEVSTLSAETASTETASSPAGQLLSHSHSLMPATQAVVMTHITPVLVILLYRSVTPQTERKKERTSLEADTDPGTCPTVTHLMHTLKNLLRLKASQRACLSASV